MFFFILICIFCLFFLVIFIQDRFKVNSGANHNPGLSQNI